MSRMDGYWWNKNDTRIVVQRTDESPVGIVTRAAIGASRSALPSSVMRPPAAAKPPLSMIVPLPSQVRIVALVMTRSVNWLSPR